MVLVYDYLELYGANAQKIIDSSYRSRIVRGQSTLKDVVERNTYRLMTTFFEIGVCPWPDLSSLFQFSILSYPAHRV